MGAPEFHGFDYSNFVRSLCTVGSVDSRFLEYSLVFERILVFFLYCFIDSDALFVRMYSEAVDF